MGNKGHFLRSLATDVSGNTMAIAAAALLPLVAVGGSAIDISRYHMTATRLQNACDAGALATRKAMGENDIDAESRAHGNALFDHNFAAGTFGLENLQRNYVADENGTVTGTATGELPSALMSIFGFDSFDVSVTCSADINISNSDIIFVLDVTGSMNCPEDGSFCPSGNNNNIEASNARIRSLRAAVLDFYDTVDEATSSAAQVRFGLVPYASNVNVGTLIPAEYMADSHTYQSREARFETDVAWEFISSTPTGVSNRRGEYRNGTVYTQTINNVANAAACQALLNQNITAFSDVYIAGSLDDDLDVESTSWNGNVRTRVLSGEARYYRGVPTYDYRSNNRRCRIGYERYDYRADMEMTYIDREVTTQEFDGWTYKPVEIDVSGFYEGNERVLTATGSNGSQVSHEWTGCIEEATTTTGSSFDPLPSGAHDLNINLVPSSDAERWRPQLPDALYKRRGGSGNSNANVNSNANMPAPSYECPKTAVRLGEISREQLEDYLREDTGFDARGSTYHDIGMLWGARLISPRGLFAADNATAPNGDAIARHIVFMTDGELSINTETYNAYGIEWWDRRISGGTNSTTIFNRHAARFQAICRQARQENISIWVVAFGTSLSQNLIDCATPGRAFHASSGAELSQRFEEIAERIAALRLTN
jgi:Flp pilus assembly protein TadG